MRRVRRYVTRNRGRIEWLDRVDVRGVDIDSDVRICERSDAVNPEVEVYDVDDPASKPPVGAKLNLAAIVTLYDVGPKRAATWTTSSGARSSGTRPGPATSSWSTTSSASGNSRFRTFSC